MFIVTDNQTIINLDLVAKVITTWDVFCDNKVGSIRFYNSDNRVIESIEINGKDKFEEYINKNLKPLLKNKF